MSIRITKIVDTDTTVLNVAGALNSEHIGLLYHVFRDINGPVTLELSALQSADRVGVAKLLEIASLGAELRGASPYIELLLERES
jgi:hypothetical protein